MDPLIVKRQSKRSHENKNLKKASRPSPRKVSRSRRLPLGKKDRPKDSVDSVKLSQPSHIGPDLTTWRGWIHEYKDTILFELIHWLNYFPAHMCGMQIHSALPKPPLLGWTSPSLALQTLSHPRHCVRRDLGLMYLSISLAIFHIMYACVCVCMHVHIYECVCIYIKRERARE